MKKKVNKRTKPSENIKLRDLVETAVFELSERLRLSTSETLILIDLVYGYSHDREDMHEAGVAMFLHDIESTLATRLEAEEGDI